ncbi:porin family protein [Massilia sp. Dwa41.01b]|uniref:porin family protein n=1 Tax=unclassified Massilia TaxID=2609279 RepID=UPI0015FFD006|nr:MULTISPECIES: porin family protein [unclassified Massilia]QNA89828.1 porin family protein [Massilia sp. Dwa41.01b]QNB00721.1 porin family protein [Massilia sp. Se16.2.3]
MFKHIAATALLLVSSQAFAAESSHFYAGVDAASTKFDNLDRDTGFGAFAGYRFNAHVAIEAGYHRLLDARAYTNVGSLPVDLTVDQAELSVIGSLPLSASLSAFGRAGISSITSEGKGNGFSDSTTDTGAVYGIGLAYAFTPALSGRVEVQKPTSDGTKTAAALVFSF